MGCSASKSSTAVVTDTNNETKSIRTTDDVYKLLVQSQKKPDALLKVSQMKLSTPQAAYRNPTTQSTPLHMACRLTDTQMSDALIQVIQNLALLFPNASRMLDASGNPPIHYVMAPPFNTSTQDYILRNKIIQILIQTDTQAAKAYFSRNNVNYHKSTTNAETPLCSPLYRAVQMLPDDFSETPPTVTFIETIAPYSPVLLNPTSGDSPLALLYRRFTRQFDLAEKFFTGDNSRPEVVKHRYQYKTAAANTWGIIEAILKGNLKTNQFRLVHRAVQMDTPPDLLRYIVETNAPELTTPDEHGCLPLHLAAAYTTKMPSMHGKYVIDELLYKFPQAASIPDKQGQYPLNIAIKAKKQWIGGGIKSLHDAYPEALDQVDLNKHRTIQQALSMLDDEEDVKEEKDNNGIVQDEHHDAIMLVQKPDATIAQVTACMWAHEEDAGVQMLGCVAISNMQQARIAVLGVAAVVNAMKAHPNEVIVQEKACMALQTMAPFDGQAEVSFVASGAIAAVVGAMQAHINDASVQEEACKAISDIVLAGGADRATIVASVSGVTAIINSLAAHPNSGPVQEAACQALVAITAFDDANVPSLPATQTESLLVAAKSKFPDTCGSFVDKLMKKLA